MTTCPPTANITLPSSWSARESMNRISRRFSSRINAKGGIGWVGMIFYPLSRSRARLTATMCWRSSCSPQCWIWSDNGRESYLPLHDACIRNLDFLPDVSDVYIFDVGVDVDVDRGALPFAWPGIIGSESCYGDNENIKSSRVISTVDLIYIGVSFFFFFSLFFSVLWLGYATCNYTQSLV